MKKKYILRYFVGLGGLPNADGHMEFDAAIMDGAPPLARGVNYVAKFCSIL
jgi:isoaspartyl peptidase/L-asparaginase-like protein (Ntn-hydrolase superfamily)